MGRGSWTLSGRRTYADKLVSALSRPQRFPYYFSDAVLHAARAVGRGNARVELTAYAGADDLDGDFAAVRRLVARRRRHVRVRLVEPGRRRLAHGRVARRRAPAPVRPCRQRRRRAARVVHALRHRAGPGCGRAQAHQLRERASRRGGRALASRRARAPAGLRAVVVRHRLRRRLAAARARSCSQLRQSPIAGAAYYQESWRPTLTADRRGGAARRARERARVVGTVAARVGEVVRHAGPRA